MRLSIKPLLLFALVACAGCTRASSDARIDHILAGPHGWIDITLHAPAPASAAVAGMAAASAAKLSHDCLLLFAVDGETMLSESGDLAQADAAKNPLGYRFTAPAGTLDTRLVITGCVRDGVQQSLSIPLQKDHLASLEFDGRQLALKSNEPYAPMSLDTLHDQVVTLQHGADSTDGALFKLTRLARLSLLLNVILVVAAIVFAIRRNRP